MTLVSFDKEKPMYQRIHDNLHRQHQALMLLRDLLQEEYALLIKHDTQAIVALEFSIHELVRQLAREKMDIISLLDGGKLLHYADLLPREDGDSLRSLYYGIDALEQISSRHASRNAELSLALLDQSQRTLQELNEQIVPHSTLTYGRRGSMDNIRPQASIISGRL